MCRRRDFQLLVVNTDRNEIIILTESFDLKHTISGVGKFDSIADVAAYGGSIYVADSNASQVMLLDSNGGVQRTTGKNSNGPMELNRPSGITCDNKGRVIVSDSLNHRIKVHLLVYDCKISG